MELAEAKSWWWRHTRRRAEPAGGLDPVEDELVEASRARVSNRPDRRERWASLLFGGGFLAAAIPLAALSAADGFPPAATLAVLLVAYVVVSRVEFEIGSGVAVPTQLVLVPMLLLLPPGLVPLCVGAGLITSAAIDHVLGRAHLSRSLVVLGSSWHAVGPALVLVLASEPAPSWDRWPLYLAALAAQFVFDFASSTGRDWVALGVPPKALVRFMGWVYLVDLALAPIGLLAAFASSTARYAFLLTLPLLGLLAILARERRVRIDHALELSHAYRGTAFLLGDVVEADDAYTGGHSRDVVSLVLAVADALELDQRDRRKAEFAALLHDIGKIRIPSEIINKPGPLTLEERAVIETHTIVGEQLLEQVGGLLAEVGRIVRSCHERWDGEGYPDGLAGEEIPLVARIVSCCDAFDAMTSTRSYRAALPLETAIAELRANAGTQFDPVVVAALVALEERVSERAPAARPAVGLHESLQVTC